MEDEILEKLCLDIFSNNPSVEEVKKELEKISNRGRLKWGKHSPLASAVTAKRKDLIQLMIKEFGFNADSKHDRHPYAALTAAIFNDDEDMVRFLVAEMNTNIGSKIRYALKRYNLPLTKLLIEEFGADVNAKVFSTKFTTFLPLHWAIYWEQK
jgi:hypothetical protein